MRADVVRPHVEQLLKGILGSEDLVVDEDGDIPVRSGSALFYVRVLDGDPSLVRVFSTMLTGVKPTKKLFKTLNDINAQIVSGRVFWVDEDIVVVTEIVGSHLDREELEHACRAIGTIADTFDDQIQREHGGEKAFDEYDALPVVDS